MDIQDEAAKRYSDPLLTHDPSRWRFIEGAEWARKEALREAVEVIQRTPHFAEQVIALGRLAALVEGDGHE